MESILNSYNPSFQQRVNYLIHSLNYVKNVMDEVACEIDDLNLSRALSGIASESCRYISELSYECKKFGLPVSINDFTLVSTFDEYNNSNFNSGLSYVVEKNEVELELAYATLLNEPHPFIHLKELLKYQFESLKSAFSKIKLLSTSRLTSDI